MPTLCIQAFPSRTDFLGEIIILWDVGTGEPLGCPIVVGIPVYSECPFQKNVAFSPSGPAFAYGEFKTKESLASHNENQC